MAKVVSEKRSGENWQCLELLTDPDGNAYTQSGVDAVAVSVFDLAAQDPTTDLFLGAQPAVSDVFFNSLQTDSGWDLPDGFNFKHIVLPADLGAAVPPGHTAKVIYDVTTIEDGVRQVARYVVVVS